MPMLLVDAPFDAPLLIHEVTDPGLALRLSRMGLFEGSEILRLDREVLVQSVRVRGEKKDAVLGGGTAMKTVVHLDKDNRRLPLADMQPGDTGHVEGFTGGKGLTDALDFLGIHADGPIRFIRKLPPMEYIAVVEGAGRERLTEGMAAKIWGRMGEQELQFVSARVGAQFTVDRILGGGKARAMFQNRGISPGKHLVLEGVAQAQSLRLATANPVVISSREGLRLFLSSEDATRISVTES
jgi:Fe2+ transport system protein FeoA